MTSTGDPPSKSNSKLEDSPSRWAEFWPELIKWAIFGVCLSLLPLFLNLLSLLTRDQEVSLAAIAGRGELLLITVVLGATATGDLLASQSQRFKALQMLIAGINIIMVLIASMWFGDISSAIRTEDSIDYGAIATGSVIVFVSQVLLSLLSIVVARLRWEQ